MSKKFIISSAFLLIAVLAMSSLVSAGLCKGYDGYYHDCDDYRYFNYYDRNYDDEYYYHGKYYPTRDYYYRDYYKPGYKKYRSNIEESYKDVEEYTRITEYKYEDRWNSENIKTTISEKTEIDLNYERPYFYNYQYYPKRDEYPHINYLDYKDKDDSKDDYIMIGSVPYHYSQYQKYHS